MSLLSPPLSALSISTTVKILQLLLPFTNLATQIVYSNINSYLTSYLTYKPYVEPNKHDYEKELDKLQMSQLLKWMKTFFDIENTAEEKDVDETEENDRERTKKEYFKELYSVYKTILSDYKQYVRWISYNRSLYILKSYRCYSTNELAKKIIYDVHLFNEGINLFCKLR
jgi:hypothetical protein